MNEKQISMPSSALSSQGNLSQILDVISRRRLTIALTTVVCLVLGGVVALTSPVYQSNILVKIDQLPEAQPSSRPELMSMVSPAFDARSKTTGEMQVIQSRQTVAHVVDELELDVVSGPRRFPVIGAWLASHASDLSKSVFGSIGGYAWGKEQVKVGAFKVPRELEDRKLTLTALSAGRYELSGSELDSPFVGTVGRTETVATTKGDVTLRIDTLVAAPGIRFDLKRLSRQDVIDDMQKNLQITEQGEKSNVVSVSMRGSDPELLSQTLNALGAQYVRENNDRNATIAANSLRFLESQLPAMQAQMVAAEHRYTAYRHSLGLVDATEEGRLNLQRVSDAEAQLLTLQRSRADLAARYAPSYPAVASLDAQIAMTKQYLEAGRARVNAMPTEQQDALALMRDVRMTTDLYTAARNNVEQLRLIQASKAGFAQIIDPAIVPEHPVRPVRSLVLAASLLLGLLAGVAISFVREMLFAGVTEPEQVEARTGLMVYGMVPHSAKQDELQSKANATDARDLILACRHPSDPAAESLRSFRSALQYMLASARNNIVMVAGPMPQVGKSFVAANLAVILAMTGKRVLLVDCDLRRGALHRSFGLPAGLGLAEVLADPSLTVELATREVLPNLDILPCGDYPANPAELLNSLAFDSLMRNASARYDIVLLDSAPALAVSDAGIIAPHAGSVFLVARFSETRLAEIEETARRFAQVGTRIHGVMLNGFALRSVKYLHPGRYGSHIYATSQHTDRVN
ncbi:tyrosine-protein kinase Etk/Wzc [Paraburkholderia atlantica]|uniref:polysaccharide biosynthesis tyrosine autokinase n=1 Tax=Paraburkholderia atlantica TaxID=2654982 RepID=UPI001591CFC1|nr:polysaccharide biosynthesis tyrosine autokinase [Paraburkholderia atlantica]NUY30160.1 polysaccharide biosynthesis tyrosine autokinase [Paraburkholderia atlantica]